MQRDALLNAKRRLPRIEKGVSSFAASWLALTRQCLVTLDLYDTEYLSKPLHQTELIIILNFEL